MRTGGSLASAFPVDWEARRFGPARRLVDRGCEARSRISFPDYSGNFFIRSI
jgi:hypothetical protein